MTQRDYQNGQLLNFNASESCEFGDQVVGVRRQGKGIQPVRGYVSGVGASPTLPAAGPLSSTNIAGTLTTGVSWLRLGIALVPLLFGGKKK